MGGVRHGSKERHPHGPYDVAVKTLADAAVASSKYPYAKPRDFVVNVLVFAVLLQYCVPLSKLWPHDGNWDDYPIPAGVYAFFRGLRLVLRCATFTCCIARFIFKCSVSEKTSTTAVDQLVHTILGTIWPTERRAMVAMGLFFSSRSAKLFRLPIEACVNNSAAFGACELTKLTHGMWSRSSWMIGLYLGYLYFTNPDEEVALPKGVAEPTMCMPRRMWKMINSRSFVSQARLTAFAWVVVSISECYLLFHWEAGVPNSVHEVDAFRYSKDHFYRYSPDFSEWDFARVVVGSWREPFYFMMLFPRSWMVFAGVAVLAIRFAPLPSVRRIALNASLGITSYLVLTSAHNLQFIILCLLVSWECYKLQERCEEYQDKFGRTSNDERIKQHQELGKAMTTLGDRIHPIIMYLVSDRIVHMTFDVALWNCSSLPFTRLHYFFRHLVRILAVFLMIWRIGRLNASIYDDLTGKVVYELVCAHQRHADLDTDQFTKKRRELKDWILYLQHNGNGKRKYCLRVCHYQCCLRSHTVAFWVSTVVLIPFYKKLFAMIPESYFF